MLVEVVHHARKERVGACGVGVTDQGHMAPPARDGDVHAPVFRQEAHLQVCG